MKNKLFFIIVFFLLGCHLSCQMRVSDSTFIKSQKIRAENLENKKDYINALNQYLYLYELDSSGINGISAKNKIDQLLPICRKLIYDKLKGKWKIKKNFERENSILKNVQYINVSNNEIVFIDDKANETRYNLELNPFFSNVVSEFPSLRIDDEVWLINFRKINKETRLIWIKKIDKEGSFIATIDDRGIIKDPQKRKIALENEIHTYFVKTK